MLLYADIGGPDSLQLGGAVQRDDRGYLQLRPAPRASHSIDQEAAHHRCCLQGKESRYFSDRWEPSLVSAKSGQAA